MNALTARKAPPRTGTGRSSCHHGEILQGAFLDERGRGCRGLVTLPLPGPRSRAVFVPEPGTSPDAITTTPNGRDKARRAATLTCELCGNITARAPCGGRLSLSSEIPDGLGMGSSSADVLAAIRAVVDAYGTHLSAETVSGIAVSAEHACDPLMFGDRPLLFAQRQGRVLEELGARLPPALVVGCLTEGATGVDTLELGAHPVREADVRTGERLRALLRRAVARSDTALLGRVSTESARNNQRVLDKTQLDSLLDIAERVGAVGLQVAHSGNVAGLIFDPASPGAGARIRACLLELARNDIPSTRVFSTRPRSRNGDGDHGRTHRGRDRTPRPDPPRKGARMPSV
ncbi:GHMP kinase [Actinopolyspora erythraea]|uniref:GHMP kinase n=1 Tax=Actinopolyspora erythraea TaxID=414996 RepID=A0A099D5A8_9ACTN|nr:GHMP kinase [Actinopolyspora erythraea]ASU78989.1 GHMP kinase [Actinopolyspora erythraea]KGI81116.1 GHMP kinase [Actinopolyspora erythraea]